MRYKIKYEYNVQTVGWDYVVSEFGKPRHVLCFGM